MSDKQSDLLRVILGPNLDWKRCEWCGMTVERLLAIYHGIKVLAVCERCKERILSLYPRPN